MATQSLYRRYRPRRFAELKGQDHVVRALRDAVRSGREGQAYLFSGPRGTGKTTSARILAKVLNCERPVDGEPCCECESCLAVERGTSYDVHELDAASNNGVDAIRELIEKASLGTPGRHKVYILDEVHMLSKAAEAALLKTLEEPPPHVVFVLATTDPQKMSDTIRSRTQHLQFHLLPADTLAEHVRWVAADAGLDVTDAAIDTVISQGGGSARDTLSALELIAATGGDAADLVDLDEFVRALIDRDAGHVLTVTAAAIRAGNEPRALTEAIVRHLRNGFLSLMAPELVLLPAHRVDEIAASAQELGAPGIVRAIERLGSTLVEMRHAPDPRVLLEVALVRLTHDELAGDLGALVERIERLEHGATTRTSPPSGPVRSPAPVDPSTGRAVLGGKARRASASASARSDESAPANAPTGVADASDTSTRPAATAPAATVPAPDHPATDVPASQSPASDAPASNAPAPDAPAPETPAPGAPAPETPAAEPAAASVSGSGVAPAEVDVPDVWEREVRPGLKPFVRALYSAGSFTRHDGSAWYFAVPNATHGDKCEAHRETVERALSEAAGTPIQIVISVGGQQPSRSASNERPDPTSGASSGASESASDDTTAGGARTGSTNPPERGPAASGADHHAELDDVDLSDLDDLTDAPPESVLGPVDRLAQAFPGAELIDDD